MRISNSEIIQIFKEINDKNKIKLQNLIVEKLSFLVYRNVEKYSKFPNYEDLVQEGFIGLIKAVKVFDYKRFDNFFSFADRWILNCILRSAKKYDIVYNPSKAKTIYLEKYEEKIDEVDFFDDILVKREKINTVRSIVNKLKNTEKNIIRNIYGIETEEKSLRISEKYCCMSYEGIRKTKIKILEKLKYNKNIVEQEMN